MLGRATTRTIFDVVDEFRECDPPLTYLGQDEAVVYGKFLEFEVLHWNGKTRVVPSEALNLPGRPDLPGYVHFHRPRLSTASMNLTPADARRFIQTYSALMLAVTGIDRESVKGSIIPFLAEGRGKLAENPALFEKAVARLKDRNVGVDPEIVVALRELDLRQWVYLRDTRSYSIFIDVKANRAFGVIGITHGIREIMDGSGLLTTTGLLRYRGRYVCDRVFSQTLWLGPGHRKSWSETLKTIKAHGRFHVEAKT